MTVSDVNPGFMNLRTRNLDIERKEREVSLSSGITKLFLLLVVGMHVT